MTCPDPMEILIQEALERASVPFTRETHSANCGLDFYLPNYDVHIEVKQFHSDRIAKQMARAPNVIAAQGADAVQFLAHLIGHSAFRSPCSSEPLASSGWASNSCSEPDQ